MSKFIVESCEFHLTEDDWNEGEGKTLSVWHEDIESADSIEGVLKNVHYLDCDYAVNERMLIDVGSSNGIFVNDPIQEGDYSRFDADLEVYVDSLDHIVKPSEEMWQKFTKSECKLYNLHICICIRKVVNLTPDDIKNMLQNNKKICN